MNEKEIPFNFDPVEADQIYDGFGRQLTGFSIMVILVPAIIKRNLSLHKRFKAGYLKTLIDFRKELDKLILAIEELKEEN